MNRFATPTRRDALQRIAALLAAGALPAGDALAQMISDKGGRIISGFPAGAGIDPVVRLVADRLRNRYLPNVIVENRTGAGGRIALEATRAAAPDGLTMTIMPESPLVIFPHIYKSLSYDPLADFEPVSKLWTLKLGLLVGPAAPVKTLQEYIAWVKLDPKHAVYGTPGAGTMHHFLGAQFGRAIGVPLQHVAYRGGAPLWQDLLGGQLPAAFSVIGFDSVERHNAGKARVLAIAETQRTRQLPDVPTFSEAGLKGLQYNEWFGMFLPARTPPEIVNRLNAVMHEVMRDPEVLSLLDRSQYDVTLSTPAELRNQMRASTANWARIVRETGYQPE